MLQSFRYQRNRRLLRGVVLLSITAWLALSLYSSCAFPPEYYAAGNSDCMAGMTLENQSSQGHTLPAPDDCLKSCATDHAKSGLNLTSDTIKGFSLLPPVIWAFVCILLLPTSSAGSYPRRRSLPPYKHPPLIYQFCSLLN